MCGRFVSSSSPEDLAAYFGVDEIAESVLEPNFNVTPTQDVYAVVEHDGRRHLDAFHWGLVPPWAKDVKIGSRMINARAETVADKGAFKASFARRRCLVPADGFYEWKKVGGSGTKARKQPMYVCRTDGAPLALAGLWSVWRGPDRDQDPLRSATIITTDANARIADIHDRMPAILPEDAWDAWLDRDNDDVESLQELLVPAPDELLTVSPVSIEVNNVRNRGSQLIDPVEPDTLF